MREADITADYRSVTKEKRLSRSLRYGGEIAADGTWKQCKPTWRG